MEWQLLWTQSLVSHITNEVNRIWIPFSEMVICLVDAVYDREKEIKHPLTKLYQEILKTHDVTHTQILEIISEEFEVLPQMLFEAIYSISDAWILSRLLDNILYQRSFELWMSQTEKQSDTTKEVLFNFQYPYNIPLIITYIEKIETYIQKAKRGQTNLEWGTILTKSGKKEPDYLADYVASKYNQYEKEVNDMLDEIFGWYNLSAMKTDKVEFFMNAKNQRWELEWEFHYDFDLSISPLKLHAYLCEVVKKKRRFVAHLLKKWISEFPYKITPLEDNN